MRTDDRVVAAARVAALGTGGAAAIHLAVAGEHFHEWWLFGTFFVALAGVQGLLAWRLWAAATTRVAAAAVVVNLATVALWVVTRTTGLPVGPEPGTPEAWGVTDGVCAVLELLAVAAAVLLLVQLRRAPTAFGERSPGRAAGLVVGVTAALVVLASGVAVAAPAEGSMHGGNSDAAGAAGASGSSGMGMSGGPSSGKSSGGNGERQQMADLPDVSSATAAQTAAARGLVTALEADTAKYRNPAAATAAGYDVQGALAKWSKIHHGKQPGAIAALHVPQHQARTDNRLLDPTAPETLIYQRAADGTLTLIGVMFTAQGQQPPARYQPYLRWHFHHTCIAPDGSRSQPAGDSTDAPCPSGTTAHTSGYMTHVWFIQPGTTSDQLRYAFAMAPPHQQLRQAATGAA